MFQVLGVFGVVLAAAGERHFIAGTAPAQVRRHKQQPRRSMHLLHVPILMVCGAPPRAAPASAPAHALTRTCGAPELPSSALALLAEKVDSSGALAIALGPERSQRLCGNQTVS